HGRRGQHQRCRQTREIELEHVGAVVERLAEIGAEEMRDEADVLDPQRPIETKLISDRFEVGRARAGLREQHGGMARGPDQEEDRQREEEERDGRQSEPLEDELLHSVLVCPLTTGCWTLLRAGEVRAPKSDGIMPDSTSVSTSCRVNTGTCFRRFEGSAPVDA